MVRFASSTPALSALAALHFSRTGMRLTVLARVFGTRTSTMQRALELLVADDVVERHERRYRTTDTPRTRASLAFAFAFLPDEVLARALSANPALGLIATDKVGVIAIAKRFPEPLDEARLRSAIEALETARPELDIQLIEHHDLPLRLMADPSLRQRMRSTITIAGDLARYLDPPRDAALRPSAQQGRHTAVARPTKAALRQFARAHGVRRIVAFGSAARDDMRPTSDVDLLVEPVSTAPGAFELSRMVGAAETMFGRDVDIVVGQPRDRALRETIASEGVVLYDAR